MIKSVTPLLVETVVMEDGTEYVRFSADKWGQWIAEESLEIEVSAKQLEPAYQDFMRALPPGPRFINKHNPRHPNQESKL